MSAAYDITAEKWERFTFERKGRVLTAYITSGHPVNGVDEQMHTELALVFNCLQRDSESDLIVLSAKGRAFCAGGISTGSRNRSRSRSASAPSAGTPSRSW